MDAQTHTHTRTYRHTDTDTDTDTHTLSAMSLLSISGNRTYCIMLPRRVFSAASVSLGYLYVCMHVCMHACCFGVCVCVCVCIYIYIYIYIYIPRVRCWVDVRKLLLLLSIMYRGLCVFVCVSEFRV